MKMFLLGVLVMWFILSYLYKFVSMSWGENVIGFPMAVCGVLFTILVSPFVLFYLIFLRHTIKSVTPAQVEKAKIMEDSKHLFGPVYICFDKKAKRLCNKVFLFRVQWLEQDEIPSLPEGNFRIGVDAELHVSG